MVAHASALPERSMRRAGAMAVAPTAEWPTDLPRPARLVHPPEPVAVTALAPDHPPALIVWRGARLRVARADGPERVHGEWWVVAGLLTDKPDAALAHDLGRLRDLFGDRAYCALTRRYGPNDALRLEAVARGEGLLQAQSPESVGGVLAVHRRL